MREALAHPAVFPHVHPHATLSGAENAFWTVLFMAFVVALGRAIAKLGGFLAGKSRYEPVSAREKDGD